MEAKDSIKIKEMSFYGYHGVLKEEKKLGQRFIISLEMFLNLSEAGKYDDLNKTVDYSDVYRRVQKVVSSGSYDLIETLAERVSNVALSYPIEAVEVEVVKPNPPIPGELGYVSVRIFRRKKDV